MPTRSRLLWASLAVLLLSGFVYAQVVHFIPVSEKRKRHAELKVLAKRFLATSDTHKRVEIRKEMLKLDRLEGANGFSIPHFVSIYREGLKQNAITRQKDVNARLQVAIALSSIDHPGTPRELRMMLSDESDAVRLRVLKGIHDNAIIRAWEQVVPQLSDPNVEIRAWAARTLGKLKQGAEGEATKPLVDLMVKTWRELKTTARTETVRRAELNTLIETVGNALEQLTGIKWKPGPETEQLPEAIKPYTSWWNRKHSSMLKDPRVGVRRNALRAVELTADRAVASELIEFMVQERQRWLRAPDVDKRQHLTLLLMSDDILQRMSGRDSSLTSTSSQTQVATVIRLWTDWWRQQVTEMGAP